MWSRIAALMVLVTAATLLINPIEIEARGGRGGSGRGGGGRGGAGRAGGGSRGGGAYRGGRTMNRTPSMSRASNRPSSSQGRRQVQNRPSASQGRVQQARTAQQRPSAANRAAQQRPSAANRADLRNQVNRYAQNRPAQNINRQTAQQRVQNFSSKHSNQIAQNRQISDRASQRLQQSRPDSNHWFDRNFFDRHNIDVGYVGAGANWWRPAAWATLATWGSWNWSTPYYYDYEDGYAYPVTAPDSTYAYPSSTATMPSQSAQSVQTTTTADESWLPLGVFAVGRDANEAAYTNRFLQLAVNRNGEIAGVLYNSTTDAAQDLTGMVDPESQQAYWLMANRTDSPIASTGIYNLTEDQTAINVHFADGSDQTWTLVRLKQ